MNNEYKDIDVRIASSLEKLTQVQKVLLWDVAKKENLSPIQIQFMIFLNSRSEEFRKVSVLAEEFDLTKATVSDAVSNLVDKGLLVKVKHKEDKRSFVLDLTSEGKKIVKRIGNWQHSLVNKINRISDVDKEKVSLFLIELIKQLFDDGTISIARMCLTCENIQRGLSGKLNKCVLTGRLFTDSEVNLNCENHKLIR